MTVFINESSTILVYVKKISNNSYLSIKLYLWAACVTRSSPILQNHGPQLLMLNQGLLQISYSPYRLVHSPSRLVQSPYRLVQSVWRMDQPIWAGPFPIRTGPVSHSSTNCASTQCSENGDFKCRSLLTVPERTHHSDYRSLLTPYSALRPHLSAVIDPIHR